MVRGSFQPDGCEFDVQVATYPVKVVLAPARNRCLVCGASADA